MFISCFIEAVVGTQLLTEYQRLLGSLTPKVADAYGKRYFSTALASMYKSDDIRLLEDFSPVSTAVEHALFAKSPRAQYLCGVPAVIMSWIANHLPAFFNDLMGSLVTGTYIPQSALPTDEERVATAERKKQERIAKNQRANMPAKQVHFKMDTSEPSNQGNQDSTNSVKNIPDSTQNGT